MKRCEMFPLTDAADTVELVVLCLVMYIGADLADTNVLLRLIENLALLHLAATFELGTGSNPMVRKCLLLFLAEPCACL